MRPRSAPPSAPSTCRASAACWPKGRLIEAGGYTDFSSALFLVPAPSEAEAIDLVRDDVYMRSGVWIDDVRARQFGRVVLVPPGSK